MTLYPMHIILVNLSWKNSGSVPQSGGFTQRSLSAEIRILQTYKPLSDNYKDGRNMDKEFHAIFTQAST